ncbi:MAG: winged helix-turn-helix transcriptional regulator [Methanocorpusculum sp.]|nr:winged helix-turn-helix transcriptional regulator [Methanocorpusculum sp.]
MEKLPPAIYCALFLFFALLTCAASADAAEPTLPPSSLPAPAEHNIITTPAPKYPTLNYSGIPTPASTATACPTLPPQKSGGTSPLLLLFAKIIPIICAAVLILVCYMRCGCSREPDSKAMTVRAYIGEHPGSMESDIISGTGFSRGSTVHTLRRLLKENMIHAEPYHKSLRYYPAGTADRMKKIIDAVLSHEKTAQIFQALREHPGSTLKELSAATGQSPQAVRWYLAQFTADGIVVRERKGRYIVYSLAKGAEQS